MRNNLLSTDTQIREAEVERLRENDAIGSAGTRSVIAQEYLLHYDANQYQTQIQRGYFW